MKLWPLFALILTFLVSTSNAEKRRSGNGSGFFITSDGYFVTNHHVAADSDGLEVKMGDKTYPARIVKLDPANDIAVLKVDGTFACLALGSDLETRAGDDVFTIGFPMVDLMGEAPKTTHGIVNAVSGIEDDPRVFQISVQIQPGNSGGPLMQKSTGSVIGVTSSSLNTRKFIKEGQALPQNVNYAMKASYIRPLLATVPGLLDKLPTAKRTERPFRDVQKETEQAVGLVIIYKEAGTSVPKMNPAPKIPQGGQTAVAGFKKEMAALEAYVKEQEAGLKTNPMAGIAMIRGIVSKLKAIKTDGLPADLNDGYTEFVAAISKMGGLFKGWPDKAEDMQRFIGKNLSEDPKYMDKFGEKMAALEKAMQPAVAKLDELGKKYGLDMTKLAPGK
jgi:hypothetical protein